MATLDALFEGIVANDKGLVNVAAKAVDRHGKVFFLWLLHTHSSFYARGQLRSDRVFAQAMSSIKRLLDARSSTLMSRFGRMRYTLSHRARS